jgi:hypothetical protein
MLISRRPTGALAIVAGAAEVFSKKEVLSLKI